MQPVNGLDFQKFLPLSYDDKTCTIIPVRYTVKKTGSCNLLPLDYLYHIQCFGPSF